MEVCNIPTMVGFGDKNILRKRNMRRKNGCLRRPYKQLWKEEMWKAKKKRKDIPNWMQRIARRDKKVFLSGQSKETEENNRMGKMRDLSKKIWDTKGTFHAKTGTIKNRNSKDLTEAEDIKKRWQEYTDYTKKVLMTWITTMLWSFI